jgi:hypothetical protein
MSNPTAVGCSEMVSNDCTMDEESTIGSTMPVDITTDYPLFYVWRYTTTDYLLCSTLAGDSTYTRLSTLLYLSILLPTIHSALSGDILHPTILCALLCLLILQPTIQSTDYALWSVWKIVQTTIYCAALCLTRLQPTICGTLLYLASLQLTTRSALPVDITSDYPLYRFSAMLEFCTFTLGIWFQLYGLGVESIGIVWKLD